LTILKDKQFLFTDYLNFCNASPNLAPLDRSMRFLDEKLQTGRSVLGPGKDQHHTQCLGTHQQPPHLSAGCLAVQGSRWSKWKARH